MSQARRLPFARYGTGLLPLLATWAVTRVLLLGLALSSTSSAGDIELYSAWGELATRGTWAGRDFAWEYPPLALVPMALPVFLGVDGLFSYRLAFCLMMYVLDAAALFLLLRIPRESRAAAWTWVIGLVALGPVAYQRFDLLPTLLAMTALVLAMRNERSAPAVALLGAAVKLWPALLLAPVLIFARSRRRAVIVTAASFAVMLLAAWSLGLHGLLRPFTYQRDRGLQVEAVAGTPLNVARALDLGGYDWSRRYGAAEIIGPGVDAVVTALQVLSALLLIAVGIGMLARARRPGTSATVPVWALLALTTFIVTDKVFSPQYMTWVLGVGCVAMTALTGRNARRLGDLLVLTCVMTQAYYPYWYYDIVLDAQLAPTLVMALRNVMLVALLSVCVLEAIREATGQQTVASG